MTAELLAQERIPVAALYGTERWLETNRWLSPQVLEIFNLVTEADLKKISALSTPNQVLAVVEMPLADFDPAWLRSDYCLYLDGIQDPGNLGAMLRIADWFGIPAVFCSPDTVDVFSPKVIQAGMGAFLRVPSFELPLDQLLEQYPELPILGAVLGGENVFESSLPGHGLLVIGREGRGLAVETEQRLTRRLTIPRHPNGGAESLNAAVAAGILAAVIRSR